MHSLPSLLSIPHLWQLYAKFLTRRSCELTAAHQTSDPPIYRYPRTPKESNQMNKVKDEKTEIVERKIEFCALETVGTLAQLIRGTFIRNPFQSEVSKTSITVDIPSTLILLDHLLRQCCLDCPWRPFLSVGLQLPEPSPYLKSIHPPFKTPQNPSNSPLHQKSLRYRHSESSISISLLCKPFVPIDKNNISFILGRESVPRRNIIRSR